MGVEVVEGEAGKEKMGLGREGKSVQDEVEGHGVEEDVDGSVVEGNEGEEVEGVGVDDDEDDDDENEGRGERIVVEELHISLNRKSASSSRFSLVVLLPTDCNIALVYFLTWIFALSVVMKTVLGRGCGCLHLEMDLTGCISFLL